jgi:hypothetical protein
MLKKAVIWIVVILLIAALGITAYVETEANYRHETISGTGSPKVLVLYHPSRDAGFSDEVSLAVAQGFKDAGLAVDRATMTGKTPASPQDYALVAVVSNTYWSHPDIPTMGYLGRARWHGMGAIGLMCGAGSTTSAEHRLKEALQKSGATVLAMRSFWVFRPNDESRRDQPNRDVARQLAHDMGFKTGQAIKREHQTTSAPQP